jgi:cell division protein FtsB
MEKIQAKPNSEKVTIVSKTMKKHRRKKSKLFKIVFFAILIIFIIGGVMGIIGYTQGKKVYEQAKITMQAGREFATAAKEQKIDEAGEKIRKLNTELTTLSNQYESMKWLSFIPFIRSYYNDGRNALAAGKEFLTAGTIALDEIKPYADLLGLTSGESSFVNQPAEKRIETAVNTFSKVTPKLKEIADHLDAAKKEFDSIDPDRYPEKVKGKVVRERIAQGKSMGDELITFFVNSQPLLEQIPELLGNNGKKQYLLLFQNDKELRSTGGFITAYALLEFDKGKMRVIRSDDIYKLDDRQTKKIEAPDEIKKYHKGVYYAYLRDSNTSPDFKESMLKFENLYNTVSGKDSYDGIIALDTEVLVKVIDDLDGDIFVPDYGANFTTKPDNRCDGCPQVIYELEEYADKPVGYAKGERKDILGKLMLSLMQKSLGVSPSIYWGKLSQTFLDLLEEKHVLIYMKDQKMQEALEAVNFAGRIVPYEYDYLHINDTNFAGAKSNMFVKHTVTQDVKVAKDGTVSKTITIDYKNPSKASNCNLEKGDLCLNGKLRNWVRIYVPKGSTLTEFKGSLTEPVVKDELGKTVFEGYLEVLPMGSSQIVVSYTIPVSVKDVYNLLIQKQPGTLGHQYIITINGKQKDEFLLTTDKELSYPL